MREVFDVVLKKLCDQSMKHRKEADSIFQDLRELPIGLTWPKENNLRMEYHRERAKELDEIIDCLHEALGIGQNIPKE